MNVEAHYLNCTKGYLELIDIMVDVARKDDQTTVQELSILLNHREFTAVVLESFYERQEGQ